MGGQLRIRIRHRETASPWFDYLFLSRPELEELLDGTGWKLTRMIEDDTPVYVAVIEKEPRASASNRLTSEACFRHIPFIRSPTRSILSRIAAAHAHVPTISAPC